MQIQIQQHEAHSWIELDCLQNYLTASQRESVQWLMSHNDHFD